MKQIYPSMLCNPLFSGISQTDFAAMLHCLGAFEKQFPKHAYILNAGDPTQHVGIVVQGGAKIAHTDYNGNELLVATVAEGDVFGEVFACVELLPSPVSVVALEDSTVVFFDYGKMISTCSASCQFHQQLIKNMLSVLANKTLYLNKRIDVISKRTLRDKILAYLHDQSQGLSHFTIPLNRENLANFLCADRSALSNELSKMQRDGLISYHKNQFQLHI